PARRSPSAQAHRTPSSISMPMRSVGATLTGGKSQRQEVVRPQRTTKGKGKEATRSLPLSPYSAPGGLRQALGRAAESPAEATTCGNQDSRSTCARGCAQPDRAEQLAEMQPH